MLEGHIGQCVSLLFGICKLYAYKLNFTIYNGYPGYRTVARGYRLQRWLQEMQELTDFIKLSEKKKSENLRYPAVKNKTRTILTDTRSA